MVQHPESVDWYQRIRAAYEKAVRVIDLPAERVRAGECSGCGEILYATAGKGTVTCKPCDEKHDVRELQAGTLARVLDYADTAQRIVDVFNGSGHPLRLTRLTKWADRRQVVFTETDIGRVFTVRDVLNTYQEMSKQ
jgi:hypothetical protein